MKNSFLFITMLLLSNFSSRSQQSLKNDIESNSTQFSQGIKLQYYAGACNASQIEVLLANDPTFDIYSSGVTNSPVMVAIDRYITANNNGPNLKTCTECLMSIKNIMKDRRYSYKEMSNRDKTDLMHLLMKGKSVTNATLQLSGYNILLFTMLDELDKKNGFDINYTLPNYLNNNPGNAIGALAASGLKSTFCTLIKRYPQLKFNLDKRKDERTFPPLMIAVLNNNMDMLNALTSNGADYYLNVEGFNNYPALELATSLNITAMITYLNNRRLGNEPADTTNNYCPN